MKGKSLVAAGLAALGMEAYNRSIALQREELEPQLPVEPTAWSWRYGDVAVYRAGDPANPPLLILHGHNAAASATEVRQPFERLSRQYNVFAPDLLGYGCSDRPPINYTAQLYIDLIHDILREVVGRPAIVLASSLSSAHAIEAAANNPEWITTLVLVCPTGVRRLTRASTAGRLVERVLRMPVVGEALYNGIASRASIRYFLEKQTYFDKSLVTGEMVENSYRTAHVPGARFAPAAFVGGSLYWDASDAWTRLQQQVLLVWGREAAITPISDAAPFLATNPRAELQEISPAGLLPHDEQPDQFANTVTAWLDRVGASAQGQATATE